MKCFIDKNIIFDFVRLIYFRESFEHYKYSALLVLLIQDKKLEGNISDSTPFSVGKYLSYKLERLNVPDADSKARNALRHIFEGRWGLRSLTHAEFLSSLNEGRLHFEDAYQFAIAKKYCDLIITKNLKDFDSVRAEISIRTPREFIEKNFKEDLPTYFEKLEDLARLTS